MSDRTSVFHDMLKDEILSNNPTSAIALADLLDDFAKLFKGEFLPSLDTTLALAGKATAILFCASQVARDAQIENQFAKEVSEAKGKSFGHKLINWVISKMDPFIAERIRIAWSGIQQYMGGAVEMLIQDLAPAITPGVPMTVPQVEEWIQSRGGITKLHWEWMAIRRTQSIAEKSVAERQRKRGQHLEQLEAAHEAGFDTIEEHAAHEAEVTKQQQEKNLRSKFGELMKRLVENGTPVEGVLPPTDRLFVSANGVLYLLSKEDEFALLSCGAATL
jgi:glycyl-tRNA synthetase beta subunit